jgi:hypothetical protein
VAIEVNPFHFVSGFHGPALNNPGKNPESGKKGKAAIIVAVGKGGIFSDLGDSQDCFSGFETFSRDTIGPGQAFHEQIFGKGSGGKGITRLPGQFVDPFFQKEADFFFRACMGVAHQTHPLLKKACHDRLFPLSLLSAPADRNDPGSQNLLLSREIGQENNE